MFIMKLKCSAKVGYMIFLFYIVKQWFIFCFYIYLKKQTPVNWNAGEKSSLGFWNLGCLCQHVKHSFKWVLQTGFDGFFFNHKFNCLHQYVWALQFIFAFMHFMMQHVVSLLIHNWNQFPPLCKLSPSLLCYLSSLGSNRLLQLYLHPFFH